ncbi:tyrosine-type recombinase/integrase, partial [Bacillus sp. FJAT-28004]|uniref:tyrosine-type recombinase/integrase n=1 Tax=Bacillus sp. FJAT-28004 TaxID=1679165 RepID=UPI000AB69EF2
METYKSWLNKQGKSEHTIDSYLNIVQNFQSWFLSHSQDDEFKPTYVTSGDVEKWKLYLLNEATYVSDKAKNITKKYSVSTVRTYLKGLKSYFHFLELTHVIPQNPAANAHAVQVSHEQQDEGEIRWFAEGERSRLLHFLNDPTYKNKNNWKASRNKAIIYAGLFAGLRRSEIVHLELDDISFEKSSLHV